MRLIKKGIILSVFSLCLFCSYTVEANNEKDNTRHVQTVVETDYSKKLKAFLQSHQKNVISEEITYDVKKERNYYLVTIKTNKKQETKKISETYVNDYFQNKNEKSAEILLNIILIPGPQ